MAREEEEEYLSRLRNRSTGRNKKAKFEGRGSCQPLESELEQLPSIFVVLRPVMEMEGSLPSETEFLNPSRSAAWEYANLDEAEHAMPRKCLLCLVFWVPNSLAEAS